MNWRPPWEHALVVTGPSGRFAEEQAALRRVATLIAGGVAPGGATELVATAIANAQAHVELRGFAEEQAALRRVGPS